MTEKDEKQKPDSSFFPGSALRFPRSNGSAFGRQKILIVDDKKENLLALRKVLADLDVEIIEATSGNEALAATLNDDFSVAILDVMMPGMDGYELAGHLRGDAKTRRLPIIFLTAFSSGEGLVFKGYEVGAVDYIIKPFNVNILLSKVEIFLELDRAHAELAEKIVALTASEEQYRSLVTTIPDIVYRLDIDGRFTYLNNAVKALGYAPEELLGSHFSKILRPDDVENVSRESVLPKYRVKSAGTEGAPRLFDERRTGKRKTMGLEVRLVPRRGGKTVPDEVHSGGPDVITVEINSSGIYAGTPDGNKTVFLGTVGIIRDITERKRAEEELARHRDKLQDLVRERVKEQACLYAISKVLAEPHDVLDDVLRQVVHVIPSGWRYSDIACARLRLDDYTVTSEPFRESRWHLAVDLVIAGQTRGTVELFYMEKLPASDQVPFLKEEKELITGIAHMLGQALERMESEKALKEARDIINKSSLVAFTWKNQEGWPVEFVSENVESLFGFPAEEFITGKVNYSGCIHPDDLERVAKEVAEAGSKEGLTEFTHEPYRVIAKDGLEKTVRDWTCIVRDHDGCVTHYKGIVEDITELKRAEDEHEKLQKQLIQSQKLEAIGTLTGGIAHDFNNLLTAIIGNADLAIGDAGKDSPLYESLADIKGAGERAAVLTRQLLAFSRKQVLQPEVLNLNKVLGNMDRMLRRVIREDIEVETLLSPDLGLVEADIGQVEQILINLAVNAGDAMPKGGKLTFETGNVELDEGYARNRIAIIPGPYVMLAVSDTGIGMTKEVQDHLFEPFFTTKEKGKGTGLGLSTVYGIVKQSGGNIWVYSEPGQGTAFNIYMPQVDKPKTDGRNLSTGYSGRDRARPSKKHKDSLEGHVLSWPKRGSETILVVEDDEMVRNLALKALKQCGYTVLCAGDGQEALHICREHKEPIQLMLTDMVMPGMSGIELAKSLEGLWPEMKVLFMSGYTDNAIVHHGVLEKGIAFIQKPFASDSLARKVREVLDTG